MQAIMESVFDVAYLVTVTIFGIMILRGAKKHRQFVIFGLMTIILGLGDAFHLIPRIWALNTAGTENFVAALGFGTLVTSITMTIFYVLLYHFWQVRYHVNGRYELTAAVYVLSIARIALCLFPQNRWINADAPMIWGIYRNIPFVILGIILIGCFAKQHKDKTFRFMWLAIVLSFAFYIPVVVWANKIPAIGMLMLPKTCAYVWMVWMGHKAMKQTTAKEKT